MTEYQPVQLPQPELEHFCDLRVDLAPVHELGDAPVGKRRIIPIVGGVVSGPSISGTILDVGADWQTVFSPTVAELDARYAFRTDDGAIIEVSNFGYRHGTEEVVRRLGAGDDVGLDEYYMRTIARLETGDPRYEWVNRMVFVGTGGRRRNSVVLSFYVVR